MVTGRVILDSDDEESDLSPRVKPGIDLDELFTSVDGPAEPQHIIDSFQTTGTTDSSFFQKIYNEHNVISPDESKSSGIKSYQASDPTRKSSAPSDMSPTTRGQRSKLKRSDLGTSVTDPAPASRRPNKRQAIDLTFTQVTTPRQQLADTDDPWEIPSSPSEAVTAEAGTASSLGGRKSLQPKIPKANGNNRRSCQSSSFPEPGYDLADGSILEAANNRADLPEDNHFPEIHTSDYGKRGVPVSAQRPQDSSFGASKQSAVRTVFDLTISTSDSTAKEPDSAFECASPGVLATSQKQVYSGIHPLLEHTQLREDDLPTLINHLENPHKSSGATTIAYTTPSEFASSGRGAGAATESGTGSKRKLNSIVEEIPPSSPDILSVTPEASRKKKGKHCHDASPSSDVAHLMTPPGAIKQPSHRNGIEEIRTEELWDRETMRFQEDRQSLSNARVATDATVNTTHSIPTLAQDGSALTTETWVLVDHPASMPDELGEPDGADLKPDPIPGLEEPRPKKKRGRKKKDSTEQGVNPEEILERSGISAPKPLAADLDTQQGPSAAKRKRGRPRKADQEQPLKLLDETLQCTKMDDHGSHLLKETNEVEEPLVNETPLAQPKKRGRRSKHKEERDGEISQINTDSVLATTSGNTSMVLEQNSPCHSSAAKALAKDEEIGAHENIATEKMLAREETKEPTKLAGSRQPGKVLYRVGLSKKSRIAPLLKSLRK